MPDPRRSPRPHRPVRRGSHTEPAAGPLPAEPVPPNAESPWVSLRAAPIGPLLYRKMIRAADRAARPGDVVAVYDRGGALLGRGLFNPDSIVTLRLLSASNERIDGAFWRARLASALELRRRLKLDAVTDAYRIVHGEGDGLSGLVVERLADVLVFEIHSIGMYRLCSDVAGVLADLLGKPSALDRPHSAADAWRRVISAPPRVEKLEGFALSDADAEQRGFAFRANAPTNLVIREHGIRYRVDLTRGHKTGFFCDQRDNRRDLAALCEGAGVLDVCCYTGGFGLCAKLLGGAAEVTGVDLDEQALAVAKENANLNQTRIHHVHADAFVYLRQMLEIPRQFDVVVLDPPKLALTRRDVDEAARKYFDLNRLGVQVTRPGGMLLTCSCSGLVSAERFAQTVAAAARAAGRRLQLLRQTGAAPDHPVMSDYPESAYLKANWYRVL